MNQAARRAPCTAPNPHCFCGLAKHREIIRNNHRAPKDFPAPFPPSSIRAFRRKRFSRCAKAGSHGKAHSDHDSNRFASCYSGAKVTAGLVSAVRRGGGDDPGERRRGGFEPAVGRGAGMDGVFRPAPHEDGGWHCFALPEFHAQAGPQNQGRMVSSRLTSCCNGKLN